ncbi:uncharacterized protein [Anolis sagrei]|uniref:uncharacterized protein n=1 Tax=Anolis sagrei TaxID=38937 RepID=UPI00352099D3
MVPWLRAYPDRAAASLLKEGFSSGFRIPAMGPRRSYTSGNLKSAAQMPEVLSGKIAKELAAGRIAGPFLAPPLDNFRVSPLGVVPKKAPGEFRLIHHLSYPRGASVNDAIPPELCSVKYASFDHAVSLVQAKGPGALMAKCDIQSAFRLLPVHPDDFNLLGFKFNGLWYFDKAMPMGCAISCAAFETFSSFLEWVARTISQSSSITHYLDDFLFVGKQGGGECARLLSTFMALAKVFGIPLAQEKTEGPSTSIVCLGIQLDSVRGLSLLPADKLSALRARIEEAAAKRKVTLRELQALLGHLNFACKVVSPGRPFCARLARATAGARAPHHRIRVTQGMREDLRVWIQFLRRYNGVSMWQTRWELGSELQVQSDASGSIGFGVFLQGHWCTAKWPDSWKKGNLLRDLTFLEFFPILVAVRIWTNLFRNKRVRFWCDNQAVVRVVNRQSSKSARVMRLVRLFVLTCLEANITFSARYIPGVNNEIADALSRFQEDRFRSLAPGADLLPASFPLDLWTLGDGRLGQD